MSIAEGPGLAGEGRASAHLAALVPLLRELGDLKRVRVAGAAGTLAEQAFRRGWAALVGGAEPDAVAREEAARALAAARLGGIDAPVLGAAGLDHDAATTVLLDAFDEVADALSEPLRAELRARLGAPGAPAAPGRLPDWVDLLAEQPRAGATRPGHPRLVLSPAETHAEHCATVALYGVLVSPEFEADPGPVFLCGLAHHLHNARWPDSGHAADVLLGDRLEPIMERLREAALAELPEPLRPALRFALDLVFRADRPEARAFQTADVLDRVLEMAHHARAAAFTLDQALEEMDLVHPGPVQAFQLDVLAEAGLR